MQPFSYARATDEAHAVRLGREPRAGFVAGGTSLLDLMKVGVEQRDAIVDLNGLPLTSIDEHEGGLRIGAMARNTELANHPVVVRRYPVLSQAILSGASPQLRNMATTAGNLLQRTRCPYFRDTSRPCNKRQPGTGCSAMDGFNRTHAILGTSDKCIATHPSDMCVALVALEAIVRVRGPDGERTIPIQDFHRAPEEHPDMETTLLRGELVTHVDLPATPFARTSAYLKVRDRASFAFALAAAAVALDVRDGVVQEARIALGGVGTKPWRSVEAEQALHRKPARAESFAAAADVALHEARPRRHNAFKVALAKRTLVRALSKVAGTT